MDIRSAIEKAWFRLAYHRKEINTPKGTLRTYMMADATIGNLPWKSGYIRKYSEYIDPMFRDSLPWEINQSNPDGISQAYAGVMLTQAKEPNTNKAILYSNFTIKYGTIRALIKLPNIKGAWSAFWLFGDNGMPEHDILEQCGQWNNRVNVTHHYGFNYDNKKSTLHNGRINRKFNPNVFNLYEVELTPYKTTYKINGFVTKVMKHGISSSQHHIIFSVTKGSYCDSGNMYEMTEDATMIVHKLEVFKTH